MDFNEEFDKEWNEAVEEYETIPDKSKISIEDREFARGFYYALWDMENVIHNYKDEIDCDIEIFDEIVKQIVEKYDNYAKEHMLMEFDELMTSILDSYVE